jgi:hypothetical protein
MSTKKNPGLGARSAPVKAALAASRISAESAPEIEPIVPLSIRLPKKTHDVLRQIAFDKRISIHSMVLEGIEKVIAAKGYAAPKL